jgi:hypothetical protein
MLVNTLMVPIAAWQHELFHRYQLLLTVYQVAIFVRLVDGGSKKGKLHAYVAHKL